MHFIKQHRRGIALVVAFAFFWLIQVGSLPLPAESESSQPTDVSVQADSQPGAIEHISAPTPRAARKSPLLPILLGVGLLATAAVVVYFFVLKHYDIRGSWNTQITWVGGWIDDPVITFSGTKKSGTLTSTYDDTGTYTVDGKNVSWRFDWDPTFVWTGTFTDKDSMSGTINWDGDTATWTATRVGAATSVPQHGSWKKPSR
ncbi:MAG: hypothetical protein JXI33_00710 [Candidatus Aminicenantes bacterium]|nr:hypothetical protein [Candidatus Aminicenantes bacterium]